MERDFKCNCFAAYSKETFLSDFSIWHNYAIKTLEKLNLAPTYIGVYGKGWSGKYTDVKRTTSRLFTRKFAGVESITFVVAPSDSDAPAYDWNCYFMLFSKEDRGLELVICFDEKYINFLSLDFQNIIKEISILLNVEYGTGYRRENIKGPSTYAMGAAEGIISNSDEAILITKWYKEGIFRGKYQEGYLRDIYPYNVLNLKHLNIKIEGVILKNWIDANAQNGNLTQISKDLWLWTVNQNEIKRIARILNFYLISYSSNISSIT